MLSDKIFRSNIKELKLISFEDYICILRNMPPPQITPDINEDWIIW